jgi:hypothetical protein
MLALAGGQRVFCDADALRSHYAAYGAASDDNSVFVNEKKHSKCCALRGATHRRLTCAVDELCDRFSPHGDFMADVCRTAVAAAMVCVAAAEALRRRRRGGRRRLGRESLIVGVIMSEYFADSPESLAGLWIRSHSVEFLAVSASGIKLQTAKTGL